MRIMVHVLAAAVSAALAFVPTDRFEPRTLVPPPPLPAQANNPIPDVARWNTEADSALFTFSTAHTVPQRIRLAVAQAALQSGHNVTQAAQISGFGSDTQLRRAWHRHGQPGTPGIAQSTATRRGL